MNDKNTFNILTLLPVNASKMVRVTHILTPASLIVLLTFMACAPLPNSNINSERNMENKENTVQKTDSEWKAILTEEQYAILREKATERPYTGKYDKFSEQGIYFCAGCGAELFSSEDKFDAGCGWPSFSDGIVKKAIETAKDLSHGMVRTEILCARCGGHLGHVFDDGPQPTGLRYCVNSGAMEFRATGK